MTQMTVHQQYIGKGIEQLSASPAFESLFLVPKALC
jgi:hypothetical protein